MGIDYGLVIPDENKSLRAGAVRPWQTKSNAECQEDLAEIRQETRHPARSAVARTLRRAAQLGDRRARATGARASGTARKRFFAWLETKAYKMHVRVLLVALPRLYAVRGLRRRAAEAEALLWRIGSAELAAAVLPQGLRMRPPEVEWTEQQLLALPGLSVHDLMLLPLERARDFFGISCCLRRSMRPPICSWARSAARINYLVDVGLGYLTLDRQSRTLSGGEVQRINLTTALGTSLVNTLFVLDEPSIGLHPRDMRRVIAVMKRLRDAGNSLWWSSTTRRSCSRRTASSTWVPAPASAAAKSSSRHSGDASSAAPTR